MMNLCIDCKHHVVRDVPDEADPMSMKPLHLCYHPQAANPVDGEATACEQQRRGHLSCGVTGEHFEAKAKV